MAMAEAKSMVTLDIPPAPAMVEERRETRLPASPDKETQGSPSWSELEVSVGDAARLEAEHPPTDHEVKVADIPCSSEAGAKVETPSIPPS